jgi:general stress protein 26
MPGADRLLESAVRTLRANPYGFLTTVGDGRPHTRLVQHVTVAGDGTVWIGTSPRSRKVADIVGNIVGNIAGDPAVTYAVEDRGAFAYVSLQARAEVVRDEADLGAHWIDDLVAFFPGGPRGGDFVLVKLRPARIELMNFAEGLHPDPYGLVPVVIERQGPSWTTVPAVRAP